MKIPGQSVRIGAAVAIVLATIIYLAVTAAQADKSYYVTIGELQAMGNKAYTRHLRVAGDVAPNSIQRSGTNAHFVLTEQGHTLQVSYQGIEPPPDTFKDGSQALAMGTYGRDGVCGSQARAQHIGAQSAGCGGTRQVESPAPLYSDRMASFRTNLLCASIRVRYDTSPVLGRVSHAVTFVFGDS
jgi:cytochrome c-type biogenesis protein CcmE